MKRLPAALVLLLTSALAAQRPSPLRDGKPVTLRGELAMEPAGRLQFVTIKTTATYQPVITGGDNQRPVHPEREVGLSGYNRYDLLYAHRGQTVTVTGTIMTDSASPYYFHSTSLKAASIRLADGTELIGAPRSRPRIAVDVGQYDATVLLPANLAAPWKYSAQGSPDPERQFLACSSNGGGDVVNCSCADGFRAIRGESAAAGGRQAARIFDDTGTAQFDTGEEARAVHLHVTCSR